MTSLPSLPYLAPWYRLARERDAILLEYGQRIVCLEGGAAEQLIPALLPLLDGTRTIDEVVSVLGDAARPAVEHVLAQLTEHGVVVAGPPVPPELPGPAARAAELLAALSPGLAPVGQVAAEVAACSVAIVGRGRPGIEAARLLRSSGIAVEWAEALGGFDLVVCAPSPCELPSLPGWNEQALAASQPWLQVLPFDGRYAAVGPLFLPGDTACYECFRLRRAANLGAPGELDALEAVPAGYPSTPALDVIAAGLAVQLALQWLSLRDHFAPGAAYTLEALPTLSLALHHVLRVPRCSACSGLADVAAPLPWFKEVPVAAG